MAYVNIRNIDITDTTNPAHVIFQHIRDFVCKRNGTFDYSSTGIGWTLHDSSYAVDEDNITDGDWVVLKSTGEGGKDQIYLYMEAGSAAFVKIGGYLYWNNSTHTGVKCWRTPYQVFNCTAGYEYYLSIYGDLDTFYLFHERKTTTYFYGVVAGRLVDVVGRSEDIGLSTGSLSSGSDVSITVDITLPDDWLVDNKLMVMDEDNIDIITIKTVNGGTKTITADLSHSFASGAKISRFFPYVLSQGQGGVHSASISPIINGDGTNVGTSGLTPLNNNISDYVNPGVYDNAFYMGRIFLYCGTAGKKAIHGSYPNIFDIYAGGTVAHGDVLTVDDINYRLFFQYSAGMIAVKEV